MDESSIDDATNGAAPKEQVIADQAIRLLSEEVAWRILACHADGEFYEPDRDTPKSVWDSLAVHPSPEVRIEAAYHATHLSDTTLDLLATDPEWRIRYALAARPFAGDTPLRALEILAKDDDKTISAFARDRIKSRKEFIEMHENWILNEWPDSTTYAQKWLIDELVRHPNEMVRRTLAASPLTPGDMLLKLAQDPSEDVRGRAGINKHAPIEALFLVANDPVPEVRAALIYFRGADLPREILEIFENDTHELVQHQLSISKIERQLLAWSLEANTPSLLN